MVSALTILPIMIGALGRWLEPKKPEHARPRRRSGAGASASPRGRGSRSRPACAILLVFAAPVTQLRLGQPDDGNQPEGRTQRVAYDRLSEAFGPGSNGPFLFAIDIPKGAAENEAQLAKLQQAVADTPGMAQVTPAAPSEDGEMATIFASRGPRRRTSGRATSSTPARGRDPAAVQGTPLKVYIGGNTAGFVDFSDKVAARPAACSSRSSSGCRCCCSSWPSGRCGSRSCPRCSTCCRSAPPTASCRGLPEGFGASLIGADSDVPIVSFIP